MKGKILSLCLVFSILLTGLCGCTKGGKDDRNVIEDNYRNYYEIFVYSFYDSDGDGIGDLKGVEEKLDYVADMGFNGIWLMPIMPSPSYHKYDVTDYMAIDPQYGTMEDFESLVKACHDKGIRLIIDFVINHSSSEHPWFKEAVSYLQGLAAGAEPDLSVCPYVDYYHFSKKAENTAWYPVAGTEWFYEGVFWDGMPDLNLSSDAIKAELEAISDFWISKGVDGYRMDAALHFEEDQTKYNGETLNWLYSYCKEKNPEFYMVSEVWVSAQIIARYYEESKTPSMFNFPVAGTDGAIFKAAAGRGDAASLVKAMVRIEELYGGGYADYIDAPFLANHDQPRIANALMAELDAMKMAGGLLLMMNGSPFVYYGEEIGMQSVGLADENKRLPMKWYADKGKAGMCAGPEASDQTFEQTFPSVEEQLKDQDSLLNYYKRALKIRNHLPEIARGSVAKVESLCQGNQAAIQKTYGDSMIGIVYNTGLEAISVNLAGTELEGLKADSFLCLHPKEKVSLKGTVLTMPARSIAILK